MNTHTIEKLLQDHLNKAKLAAPIADGGPCAGIQIFRSAIECASSDEEITKWLKQAVEDFGSFERRIVEQYLAACPGVRRGDLLLVRRNPPKADRIRDEKLGLLHWTLSGRSGVRVSDWSQDRHSAQAIATENARREAAAAAEKRAEIKGAGVWD